jgi:hypothetical protein
MSAGNLPARKVKSNRKMAGVEFGHLQIAANGEIQFAQTVDVYYGYCFETGLDEYCYWYPASNRRRRTTKIDGPLRAVT